MKRKIIVGLCIIAAIVCVIVYNVLNKKESLPRLNENGINENSLRLVVEIQGEVNRPGLYFVDEHFRIIDVINLASGLKANADIRDVNLATKVYDGMNIYIKSSNITTTGKIPIYYNETNATYDIVEVKGEVNFPGLYSIPRETRIYDLIIIAGGLTNNADIININMTAIMKDGGMIRIPHKSSGKENESEIQKISINTDNIEELMQLSGIGAVKADNIIAYRKQYGNFTLLEELLNVSGISNTIYNNIKDLICL